MTSDLINLLACPSDLSSLDHSKGGLVCEKGHCYPIVKGIPVLLRPDAQPNHSAFRATWRLISCTDEALSNERLAAAKIDVDPYVQRAIVETCGLLYAQQLGRLERYPIPDIPLQRPQSENVLLDIGCNWGRWSISASRLGFSVIGIDPSLEALLAARRVAEQLHMKATFVVADARSLPFQSNVIDCVWSYSVLQHFSKTNAKRAIAEAGRVLKGGGVAKIQMPNWAGLRNLYSQLRRGFRNPKDFEVRYWGIAELEKAFSFGIGPCATTVDGFFSLNPRTSDLDLLPPLFRLLVQISDVLRRSSSRVAVLKMFADSIFVEAHRPVWKS